MARSESERLKITPDVSGCVREVATPLMMIDGLLFQEFKRFEDAMKSENFRKMFVGYAKELADPENKKVTDIV